MRKIGYVLTPVEFGGSERVNLTFLNNADNTCYDILPIVLIRPWEEHNLFVEHMERAFQLFKLPVAIKPPSAGKDYLRIPRCFVKLYKYLSTKKIDLVHTHGYFADIIGIPVAKLLRVPHISTCHGFISNNRKLAAYNILDRFLLRFSDKIIAVSEQIRDDLKRSGIRESKITVIENAAKIVDCRDDLKRNRQKARKLLSIIGNEFAVGYVGRLSEEKGVQYLIEAGVLLNEAGIPCKILIIGDGPRREDLEDMVTAEGLENNIIFTGFQTNIEEWLPALDTFVLPSLTEGTPMALLEAMSFGIPTIATRVGGVPKIIENGKNGILVNSADPMAIAENIRILFHHTSLRKKIGEEAVELVEKRYNAKDWSRKIETQYDLLTLKKEKRPRRKEKCPGR